MSLNTFRTFLIGFAIMALVGCTAHQKTSKVSTAAPPTKAETTVQDAGAGLKPESQVLPLLANKGAPLKSLTLEEMKQLDPMEIESIELIKNKESIKTYTSESYDAVMIIHLKEPFQPSSERQASMIKTPTGLLYEVLQGGVGEPAKEGDEILLRETTSYRNGTILYSNFESGDPVKVKIGAGQATTAVDEGLRGMRSGEIRKLIAAPHLVKRTTYPSNVSPDSTLVIKLQLVRILEK